MRMGVVVCQATSVGHSGSNAGLQSSAPQGLNSAQCEQPKYWQAVDWTPRQTLHSSDSRAQPITWSLSFEFGMHNWKRPREGGGGVSDGRAPHHQGSRQMAQWKAAS